jgi:hyperosmotically inducible protein
MKLRILVSIAAALVLAGPAQAEKTAGDVIDDSTVNASVKAKLLDTKGTPAMDINVETYEGIVQLSGFVESADAKKKAGEVTKDVKGVKEVRNSISVHPATSMGTKLDDTVLTTKVKSKLIEEFGAKANEINVESKGGIVQMAGFVDSKDMMKKAGELAAATDGVSKVENVLIVK